MTLPRKVDPIDRASRATTRQVGRRALDNADRMIASPPRQRGPPTQPVANPDVERLVPDLNELVASHARFAGHAPDEIRADAADFARYRIRSMGAIKRSAKQAVKFLIDDHRKIEQKGFPALSLIVDPFGHLSVNIQNEQADGKVRYAEIDTPRALTTLTPCALGSGRPAQTGSENV